MSTKPVRRKLAVGFYNVWLSFSLIGILLPCLTVTGKLSADDFYIWHKLLSQHPPLAALVERFPFLDLTQVCPWCAQWAWHEPSIGVLPRYIRYGLFNLATIGLLVIFRRPIQRHLMAVVVWLSQDHLRYPRWVIVIFVLFFLFTYHTKAHWGFWWFGIPGWTYEHYRSGLRNILPPRFEADKARVDAPLFCNAPSYLTTPRSSTTKAISSGRPCSCTIRLEKCYRATPNCSISCSQIMCGIIFRTKRNARQPCSALCNTRSVGWVSRADFFSHARSLTPTIIRICGSKTNFILDTGYFCSTRSPATRRGCDSW